MKNRIFTNKQELLEVIKILEENKVEDVVELIYDNESGIGSTLDVEFGFVLNNRTVSVRVSVIGVENW